MEEKLVIFNKYPNAIDANIIKGALEASGIPAGVLGDSTANAVWMAPVPVVVFRRDLEEAIKVIYSADINYDDYKEDMDLAAFEHLRECNEVFCDLALKLHPEVAGKTYRELYAKAISAYEDGDLETLKQIRSSLSLP